MAREVNAHHESLRASEHNTSTPSYEWEIAALRQDGSIEYRTEYQKSRKDAIRAAAELNALDVDEMPDGIVAFKAVEKEE